jgi:glucose/arabinose dehydrogenase
MKDIKFLQSFLFLLGGSFLRAATFTQSGFTEGVLASLGTSADAGGGWTAMAFAPDGRLFVCEQGGRLRVVKNGALLPAPFMTLTVNNSGERGLLGIAFHPAFATTDPYVYVYYTVPSPLHNRISRFRPDSANPDVVLAGSEEILVDLDPLSASNHNGGALHFGPDGHLYVGVGENARWLEAQRVGNRLGKILRYEPDGAIPADNPAAFTVVDNGVTLSTTPAGANRAIWSLGVRNPFTFAFQPGTGRMFINDVGQDSWEEVDGGIAGSNYGWPVSEGATTNPNFRGPLHAYQNVGSNCAIIGAAFYNPSVQNFPSDHTGDFFFGDLCGGWMRKLEAPDYSAATDFAAGINGIIDIDIGPDGGLYYLESGRGRVMRVVNGTTQAPVITAQPADRTVAAGQPAPFTVSASGTPAPAFQWRRNGADIPGATGAGYTLPAAVAADNGARFRCVATNPSGSAVSNEAVLTVTVGRRPTAVITAPASGGLYRAGQSYSFAGTGTDPEDGALPDSAFRWSIRFEHDTHEHPVLSSDGVTGGTLDIGDSGETATNVRYRINLTVTDADGLSHMTTSYMLPGVSTVTVTTVPPGLQVAVDGQPRTGPVDMPGVIGMRRSLGASSPQTLNGVVYEFQSWSDGGAQTHDVPMPASSDTCTVVFREALPARPRRLRDR